MMTALIKMGQIEKDCVTMEIQKGLPAGHCALLSLSSRQIEKKEKGGGEKQHLSDECRKDEVIYDEGNNVSLGLRILSSHL